MSEVGGRGPLPSTAPRASEDKYGVTADTRRLLIFDTRAPRLHFLDLEPIYRLAIRRPHVLFFLPVAYAACSVK